MSWTKCFTRLRGETGVLSILCVSNRDSGYQSNRLDKNFKTNFMTKKSVGLRNMYP